MITGNTIDTDHDFKTSLVIYKNFPLWVTFPIRADNRQHEVAQMPQQLVKVYHKTYYLITYQSVNYDIQKYLLT